MSKTKKDKAPSSPYVEEMWQQYMETALWSTNDDSSESGEEPLDRNYSTSDIVAKDRQKMHDDCARFYEENWKLLYDGGWPEDKAGHQFWLNRNGHGSGFWDADYGTDESREALNVAAHKFGEVNLYVHRGHIYQTP